MKGAKFLLGISLSLGTLGAAVGGAVFANNTNKSAEPAEATDSEWGYVGDGQVHSWTPSERVRLSTTGHSVLHSYKQFTFDPNEEFKLMKTDNWGSEIGASNVKFGDALSKFDLSGGNIKCTTAGTYDVCVAWSAAESADYIGIFTAGKLSGGSVTTKYIYIAEKPDDGGYWVPSKIYSFDGVKQFGAWDGGTIDEQTGYSVTATVNLNSEYGNITRVPYILADNSFLLHNGGGYQSANTSLVENSCYYYNGKGEYGDDSGKVLLANSTDLGAAAAFITDTENARNQVSENPSKRIAQYSICGLSNGTLSTLAGAYNSLTPSQKAFVRNSTVTTYVGEYGSEEGTVSYGDIADEILLLNSKRNGSSMNLMSLSIGNSTSYIFVSLAIVSIVALATGGYFYFRKRKVTE